jgi:hypothetical protein
MAGNTRDTDPAAKLTDASKYFSDQAHGQLDWEYLNRSLNIAQPSNLPPVPASLTFASLQLDTVRRFLVLSADCAAGKGFLVIYYGPFADKDWQPTDPNDRTNYRMYLVATVNGAFPIAEIPVGGLLADGALGISNLQLMLTTTDITKDEVKSFKTWIKEELFQGDDAFPLPLVDGMYSRATFRCFINMLGSGYALTLELFKSDEKEIKKSAKSATPIERKTGAVQILAAGLQYTPQDATNGLVGISMDVQINFGEAFYLFLEGCTFSVTLPQLDKTKSWVPQIAGVGVGNKIGKGISFAGQLNVNSLSPINITGGMMVSIEEQFGVACMAGYAEKDGQSSFFGYGFLKIPSEAMQPFELDGVALGFAYNRDLVIPKVEDLYGFPFIAAAMSFADPTGPFLDPFPANPQQNGDIEPALASLGTTAPQKNGAYWLTAGIAFSLAGRVIKGFALLTFEIGSETRIAAFGQLRATMPPEASYVSETPKILFIDAFLDIVIDVTGGLISLDSFIRNTSFVVEKDAKLTGAVALRYWTGGKYSGKFVMSAGGFSPHLNLESYPYYPTVPRIKFSLQLTSRIQVAGETYYALTSALASYGMAFQISANFGDVKVWANILFDALLAWDPFHYDLDVQLEFGATFHVKVWFVHISVTVHVGAGLHMWGPTFSGTAHLDLGVISVSFHVGGSSSQTPTPITWLQFENRYLPPLPSLPPNTGEPADDQTKAVVSISITSDQMITLRRTIPDDIAWVVDPETTVITTRTATPANFWSVYHFGDTDDDDLSQMVEIGVAPCGVPPGLSMKHLVTISSSDGQTFPVKITPITADVSAALWGDYRAKLDDPGASVEGTVVGLSIEPVHPAPKVTLPADSDDLRDPEDVFPFDRLLPSTDHAGDFSSVGVCDTIASTRATANRAALLGAFAGLLLLTEIPEVKVGDLDVSGFANNQDLTLFTNSPRLRLLGEDRA